ncbi:hypothetical protein C8J55DRAFT_490350 [Lentinula edodes]|uniref:Uncharacterized protein n=1 Tax=Lentinula lateritia TaxID=40482 RepID=A0A9W9A8B1_9AGAR|nr:hypothetical protein C8J55DRAFT_490350 [Lentinula edodes]
MTTTQRRQRRKNANRKEMDLELETKEIEDRAPSESAGPSGENTIAWRRESKDRTRDHHIYDMCRAPCVVAHGTRQILREIPQGWYLQLPASLIRDPSLLESR